MPTSLIDQINPSRHLVKPGQAFRLSKHDPSDTGGMERTKEADKALKLIRKRITDLQQRLYAEGKQALLVVLQAMDTGGKDSTIRQVTKGVNPQGCEIYGFKAPSKEELAHDFLWRVHARVPQKGHIGIFNRSHYEDVLIVRVHGWASPDEIERRYEHINAFERLLGETGTQVVKIMLHISPEFQLERLRRRLRRPDKHWKFNPADLSERSRWGDYMEAYERALHQCSTIAAPWYVVPAEHRWYRNLVVGRLILDALEGMNPEYPPATFDPQDFPPESLI